MRRTGVFLAAAAMAAVGIAGCGGGGGDDQAADDKAASEKSGSADKANLTAYCDQVKDTNKVLKGLGGEDLEAAKAASEKVSGKLGEVVAVAPADIKTDWQTMQTGFGKMTDTYGLLDDVDQEKLKQVKSGDAKELEKLFPPAQVKLVEQFKSAQAKVTADMAKPGAAITKDVKKRCKVTLGS